jgi:EpsI family protein
MISTYLKPRRLSVAALALAICAMVGSVALAENLKPARLWATQLGEPRYADVVPKAFGDWVELPSAGRTMVDPVQSDNLARLYTETLARTFLHKPSNRVLMLSIAYGRDQSTDTQLHTPENCYPSQGFRIDSQLDETLSTPYGGIKAVRMATRLSERSEPLTFFIRVGDGVVRGSKERNLARLRMALRGYLVDGMLLRVSEVSNRTEQSYQLQSQFIADLLGAVGPSGRRVLIGQGLGS